MPGRAPAAPARPGGAALIGLEAIAFTGRGLNRPECVLAHRSGVLVTPDWRGRGGVAVTAPDGETRHIEAAGVDEPLRPNGIALAPGGRVLLAHLGPERGGVFALAAHGAVEPIVTAVDGRPMPPTNFVLPDEQGRLWITVSTRRVPRQSAYRGDVADGFIALYDRGRCRVVADALGYANECAFDARRGRLYVNETFARRVTAFDVGEDGALSRRRAVATFGAGVYPDGLARDAEGGLWITSPISDRVIRVDRDGAVETVLADSDPAHLEWTEAAFAAGRLGREHLEKAGGRRLRNISNLAFGGPDLRTAYLGSLLGDRIAWFRSPWAGIAPPHWALDLGPLATAGETR